MTYETLKVSFEETICFIQIQRPAANNTINRQLVRDFSDVLSICETTATLVVLSGLPEVFCLGADFSELAGLADAATAAPHDPEALYDVWLKMATGPFITIAHVRGKVNAGGVGFAAACNVVLADSSASFSLSELLFGLYPACVLPFLIRRVGFQRANYLTLMTHPFPAAEAREWGLVDATDTNSEALLRRHLLRLRKLSRPAIQRYKAYLNQINGSLVEMKKPALAGNLEIFSDPANLAGINRYVQTGLFPWEEN
jgi:polyketide biosynthesis enoyl-CoA hydratase PksH